MIYTAGFDGSAKPNPGEMQIGYWIKKDGKQYISQSENIGYGTNNQAEYTALLALLEIATSLGIKEMEIHGDSALVVNQVNGTWKAKNPTMKTYRDECQRLMKNVNYTLKHVLREFNSEADSLTR